MFHRNTCMTHDKKPLLAHTSTTAVFVCQADIFGFQKYMSEEKVKF